MKNYTTLILLTIISILSIILLISMLFLGCISKLDSVSIGNGVAKIRYIGADSEVDMVLGLLEPSVPPDAGLGDF